MDDTTPFEPPAGPDAALDRYARLVRSALGVPIALVSLVSPTRQVFPGAVGLPPPWQASRETPLSHSFCQYVVATSQPLVVADARQDDVLRDNLAIPDLGVIAYAGVPLRDAAGAVVGSLCAIDDPPRQWTLTELCRRGVPDHDLAVFGLDRLRQERLLEHHDDGGLLLGVVPDADRGESEVVLARGATVLLYTDGLVERRGQSLDVGLELLRATLVDLAAQDGTLDDMVDAVLARVAPGAGEDDVALLAVRLQRPSTGTPAPA